MTDPPLSPRIAPLSSADQDAQHTELLGAIATTTGPATNIFRTLVRHPGLFRRWLPFGGKLLAGKLPPRDRELAILRTGWRCGSQYEWGQHVLIGRAAGLTDEEIRRIQAGPDASEAARYDDRQLIELVMLIGHYHMVAFTLNTLGVQREPGVPGFDS